MRDAPLTRWARSPVCDRNVCGQRFATQGRRWRRRGGGVPCSRNRGVENFVQHIGLIFWRGVIPPKTQVGFPRIFLLSKHGTWNKSSYPNSLVSRMIPVKVSGSSQIFERMTFLCSVFQVLGGGFGKSRAIFSWTPTPEKKFIESLGRVWFQVCSWNRSASSVEPRERVLLQLWEHCFSLSPT